MKTTTFSKSLQVIAGLSLALGLQGWAIEAPADDTPPPIVEQPAPQVDADTAFLGVVTTQVPAMLSTHLGLEKGNGIIVQALMPDGPASQAGLERYDIITHIGNEAITSPENFSKLVKSHKPSDTINLRLIHKGKTTDMKATLTKRPQAATNLGAQPLKQLELQGVPPEMADRMRDMIEDKVLRQPMPPGAAIPLEIDPTIDQSMRQMHQRLKDSIIENNNPPNRTARDINLTTKFRVIDGEGTIEFETNNNFNDLTVRDVDGEVVWAGPWNTPEDQAAAPKEIQERIRKSSIDKFGKGSINLRTK